MQKFSPRGEFVAAIGGAGSGAGEFQRPSGIEWRAGRLYIVDAFNNRVQVFSDDGEFEGVLSSADGPATLEFPYDLALGGDGSLFIIEYKAGRLTKLSAEGDLVGRYGAAGTGEGEFRTPWGLAARGNRVYVADTGNRRIVELELAP